jgi:hypothetical protein
VLAAQGDKQHRHKAMLVKAADEQRWWESAARATKSDAVIERIRSEIALCAAPLDAILAKIACKEAAFLMKAESAKLAKAADDAATWAANSAALALVEKHHRHEAMLVADTDEARRPTSYVDAVLFNMGGGTQPSLPLAVLPLDLVPAALPSSEVDGQLQTVHPRTRPRSRTGRRNIPRAPSSFVEVAPTHPELLQGGLPTPTSTMLARATSPCCSVVSSPTPASTTPHPPSLHPFTFDDGTIHSSKGGNAHPFRARGLPLPPWKQTQRKYHPHRTCWRHQPRTPNQSTGWA